MLDFPARFIRREGHDFPGWFYFHPFVARVTVITLGTVAIEPYPIAVLRRFRLGAGDFLK